MPITKDPEKYDQLHAQLLRQILIAIKDELEHSDLDHNHVYELTGKIAFAVTAAIDGGTAVTSEGEPPLPFLAFSESEAKRDTLIVNDHGSYLHELVYSFFDGIFEEHDEHDEEDDEDEDEEDDDEDYEYEDDEEEDEDEDEDEDENSEEDEEPRRH